MRPGRLRLLLRLLLPLLLLAAARTTCNGLACTGQTPSIENSLAASNFSQANAAFASPVRHPAFLLFAWSESVISDGALAFVQLLAFNASNSPRVLSEVSAPLAFGTTSRALQVAFFAPNDTSPTVEHFIIMRYNATAVGAAPSVLTLVTHGLLNFSNPQAPSLSLVRTVNIMHTNGIPNANDSLTMAPLSQQRTYSARYASLAADPWRSDTLFVLGSIRLGFSSLVIGSNYNLGLVAMQIRNGSLFVYDPILSVLPTSQFSFSVTPDSPDLPSLAFVAPDTGLYLFVRLDFGAGFLSAGHFVLGMNSSSVWLKSYQALCT